MKRTLQVLFAVCLPVAWGPTAGADTTVPSSISVNTTWTLAGSPYIVPASVSVASAATLTIEPGVTVKFATGTYLDVYGKLLADGTSSSRITFTSTSAIPARGAWGCIYFEPGANPSASRISYADVSWGGGAYGAAVVILGSSPAISNTTITESSTNGLKLYGGATPTLTAVTSSSNTTSGIRVESTNSTATITGSTLSGNGAYGIDLVTGGGASISDTTITSNANYAIGAEASTRLLSASGLTVSGNGAGTKNSIGYRGGTVTGAETWRKFTNLDWIVTTSFSLSSTGVLTIEPGVTVKFDSAKYLSVSGKLLAEGTAASRITFTSSAATPARGAWGGIDFGSGANPSLSRISYTDILYGGGANSAAVFINGSSPAISNTTITESSTNGVRLYGGATPTLTAVTISNNTTSGIRVESTNSTTATITGSTLSGNGAYGIDLVTGGGASISDTTITNNANYAIGAEASTRLLSASGLTVSGNGAGTKNSIGYRGGTLTGSETWRKFTNLDWIITTSFSLSSTGVLTIEPGVTVKFDSAKYLSVSGKLLAEGTAASRITFTSSAATPARGAWGSISFEAGANASLSRISYADILYSGGLQGAAIVMNGSSPRISQATISESSSLAVKFSNSAGTLEHTRLFNNTLGISNVTPATIAFARFIDWGSPTGPSGSGPGTGSAVSTGVTYDPWLAAPPSAPQSFNTFTVQNQTFNPGAAVTVNYDFGSAFSGSWTGAVYNSASILQRTFTGTGAAGQVSWDGRNETGSVQPDGVYTVRFDSTATEGTATQIRARAIIDSTLQLTLTGFAISQRYISPNADTIQDTTTASASTNQATATWLAEVKDASGAVISSGTGTGLSYSYLWDGKTAGGVVAASGEYTVHLTVQQGTGQVVASGPVTLDTISPVAVITSPGTGATVSNVRQSGSAQVAVIGTVSDANFSRWTLEDGAGAAPTTWSAVANGTAPVSSATIGLWNTILRPNGVHSVRLTVFDKAGNQTVTTVSPSVANFSMSQTELERNVGLGQQITYTSIVPFTVSQSLVIKNEAGQIVRTLLNGQSRAAGTYTDLWNGRDDQGALLRDGTYFYSSPVVEGASSMTWDESGASRAGYDAYKSFYTYPAWDPWLNQPWCSVTTLSRREGFGSSWGR